MRAIPIAAITFAGLLLSSIGARADGTWCANYKNGATNCGFYSFAQCEATRSGNGGFCYPNSFAGSVGSAYGYATGSKRRYRRDH